MHVLQRGRSLREGQTLTVITYTMLVAALAIPLVVGLCFHNKWLAFVVGAVSFYGLTVWIGQYNRATDPQYDSIAPAIWIVFGWVPAVLYSGLCSIWGLLRRKARQRRAGKSEGIA